MAIYHFSAKVISRAAGSSACASAAYRSASRLTDERLGRDHDFTNKPDVIHSEVLLPDGAPDAFADRERLWNAVEAGEVRKDAQLAREVEFAIPREMSQEQGISLARDFVQREFVDQGMIADLNVHWDRGADGLMKPHAHVMLTLREVGEEGFGKKVRDWNRTERLQEWRERWADHVNTRLTELDIDARIDHRSFADRGIGLEPQHKIGPAASRMAEDGVASDRQDDHQRIARENGEALIRKPAVALAMITREQATFTERDLARFVHRHSDGKDQFDRVLSAVRASPELVPLGIDGRGEARFTSRPMLAIEQRLEQSAGALADRRDHGVSERHQEAAMSAAARRGLTLSAEQARALEHVTGKEGLASVVGYAGSGKSAMLGVAREAWEAEGYTVRGAALSGIAAENLEGGSGIASRTLASLEHQWDQGRDGLTGRDVLVIDEAGMIGSRQMERVLSHAREAGAKVVLVGDPEQLQAIEAGAAFRAIAERRGAVEIAEVRRQREDWQRDATRALATGRTEEAIDAYARDGLVHAASTREQARTELVDRWDRDRQAAPDASRIVLTHTNAEVRELNELARSRLRSAGDLGDDVEVKVDRGERTFAVGDRVMFLKNERSLGVKNGTLGVLEQASPERLNVRLDDGRRVAFDLKDYTHLDHGYAATFHKAQGVTVDRAHVLATPGMDRHAAYVGMSRHRDRLDLHYGQDDFADRDALVRTLSRDRGKDMASDYVDVFAERRGWDGPGREMASPSPGPTQDLNEARRLANRAAFERHARAVAAMFQAHDRGSTQADPAERERRAERTEELREARRGLNALNPNYSRDVERAYRADPGLAHEAAGGKINRAVQAMRLEEELRVTAPARADAFVDRWRDLDAQRLAAYRAGDMRGERTLRNTMGGMAKSLERDPQLESILAAKKSAQLGIDGLASERSVTRQLAINIGFDLGRGLGLGL
jgi:Ti-type conjugative transfer relaxase TraA